MYIGIDGGGTKTACAVCNDDLTVRLASCTLGSCHIRQVGAAGIERVLSDALDFCAPYLTGTPASQVHVCIGLAGYGADTSTRADIEAAVVRACGAYDSFVTSDIDAAHAAALAGGDGIVVIAGTGSIALGKRGTRTQRCGGWGPRFGDEGSGYWIGQACLRAFSQQSDGRLACGPLLQLVRAHFGVANDFDVIGIVEREGAHRRRSIAALTKVVVEAARQGDAAAIDILHTAARMDAAMVEPIVTSLFAQDTNGVDAASGADESVRVAATHGAVAVADAAKGTMFGTRAPSDTHATSATCADDATPSSRIAVSYVGGTFLAKEFILDPLKTLLPASCTLVSPAYSPTLGACIRYRQQHGA